MEFRLLGPMDAHHDGHPVPLGRRRQQRVLLALLLLEHNTVVPVPRLLDLVWDGAPPEGARATMQAHVSRLRAVLDPTSDGRHGVGLERSGDGYLIRVAPKTVDAQRFRALLDEARQLTDAAERAAVLRRAIKLWRGPLLGDVASDRLRDRVARPWEEARLAALEGAIEAELDCGSHRDLVGELTGLVREYPVRERLVGLLMLALYRSGRQTEALEVFARLDRHLREQVGVDPAPALRELQQQILTTDQLLSGTDDVQHSAGTEPLKPGPVPQQLPAAPAWFTGREPELAALTHAVDTPGDATAQPGQTVVISAIAGAGGIGKTWLALHWAHQHRDRFPDGQLFVDLRGFAPVGNPVSPQSAVRGFLDGLRIRSDRIPVELDAQIALYRSSIAGQRMLILLDNAADAAQVTPLLPGSPTCTVLITSRRYLPSLVTRHNAHHLPLDVLSDAEARHLLAARLGTERVAGEAEAVETLLARCHGFPLALGIVIGRALAHPEFPLSVLAAELGDDTDAIGALDDADAAASLPAVLSWSVRALTEEQARLFGLLGTAPGPDIGVPATASLADRSEGQVRAALQELEHASLVQQHAPGRYRMHDLIRRYATDTARDNLAGNVRDAALRRVLDFYTHTAYTADRLLDPHRGSIHLDPPTDGVRPRPLPDASAAMAWFDVEYPALLAAQHTATSHAWHPTVWELAWTLYTFQTRRGHRNDHLAAWQAALHAAGQLSDPARHVITHRRLGHAYTSLGRHEEARGHLHQALALAEEHDDLSQQAYTHQMLASTWTRWGDDRQAMAHAIRARELHRAVDQPMGEAEALNTAGWSAAQLGEYDTARTHCRAALALLRQQQHLYGEACTLDSLGYIAHHTGQHQQAIDDYQQALTIFRSLGHLSQVASTLDDLGRPHVVLGEHEQAREVWREALRLYREQGRDADAEHMRQQLATLDH